MLVALGLLLATRGAAAEEPIRLKVVGGLDQIAQYLRYEAPFWTETVPRLTEGRVVA